jgi:hypothetical protein
MARTKTKTCNPLVEVLKANPTVKFKVAAEVLGMTESGAYRLRKAGKFPVPVIDVGPRTHIVPTRPLLELLGEEV